MARYARFHGSRTAARRYSVHHKNAQRWLKEDLDKVRVSKRSKRLNKKGGGRKLSYPKEVDDEILQWILVKREECNVPVSKQSIRMKALTKIKPIQPEFKASEGWVQCFLQRHNLVLRQRTSIAQELPANLEEKVVRFRQDVHFVRQNGDFPYHRIANMDETPVFFDTVPSKTVDTRGKKSIKVRTTGSEKRRITAVLSCTSTGKMLPPMIIFKGTTTRCTRGISSSNGTVVSYQKKAWVDEHEMMKWITDIWIVYTKKEPSLLFLDSFSAHLTDKVKDTFKRYNTTIVVIPGGCTSVLQPLDVSINKPVKSILRQSWERYMLEQSENDTAKIPPPPKQLIVDWVEAANGTLDANPTIVKKAFVVTGLSNSLGGHEDELIRNDDVRKEIDDIVGEVFGEDAMGFNAPNDQNDEDDPFESDDSSSDINGDDSDEEDTTVGEQNTGSEIPCIGSSSDGSDIDSLTAPDFETISDSDQFIC